MPWMPSAARMLRWIVGSQMLLVQIASNVPTQNNSPTIVLNEFCRLNNCSGTKRMNSRSSTLWDRSLARRLAPRRAPPRNAPARPCRGG